MPRNNTNSTQHHCPGAKISGEPCRMVKVQKSEPVGKNEKATVTYCKTHQELCAKHNYHQLKGEPCLACQAGTATQGRAAKKAEKSKKEKEAKEAEEAEANRKVRVKPRHKIPE